MDEILEIADDSSNDWIPTSGTKDWSRRSSRTRCSGSRLAIKPRLLSMPGRVFQAEVRQVIDAIAAGQLGTSAALVEAETRTTEGRALAVIDVTDDMSGYNIPVGSTAQVAIYTHHWHHVALIRKILLRMRSWQNYVFLEGH